ncbi:MAG: hypothetical protein JJU03_08940 [Idiomarina sp.]|nr:hypothetical protein [Idiomarina sp.]
MSRCLSLLSLSFALYLVNTAAMADEETQSQPWQWMLGTHTNYQHSLRNPDSAATPLLYSVQRIDDSDAEGMILLSQQAYLFTSDKPLRRRIYQFIQHRQGWVQHIFELPADLLDTQLSQREHWRPLHGCSIQWQQQDDHFVGTNEPRECYFYVEDSGERVAVSSAIHLFPDYFVVNDNLEFTDEAMIEGTATETHTEYQRTTFYAATVEYSALSNGQWESVNTTAQLHDQGARVGLVLDESALELRYQIELQRTLGQLTFRLHDLSRGEVVHEEAFDIDTKVIEYTSPRLRIRLEPRP